MIAVTTGWHKRSTQWNLSSNHASRTWLVMFHSSSIDQIKCTNKKSETMTPPPELWADWNKTWHLPILKKNLPEHVIYLRWTPGSSLLAFLKCHLLPATLDRLSTLHWPLSNSNHLQLPVTRLRERNDELKTWKQPEKYFDFWWFKHITPHCCL